MTDSIVDHTARASAKEAQAAISTHERHCGERWQEARKAADATNDALKEGFNKASSSISRLHARIDRIVWAVAVGAVGLLGNMVVIWLKSGG